MARAGDIQDVMKSRIAVVSELFDLIHPIVDAMTDGSLSLEELKEVAAAMRPVANMIRKKKTG